MKAPLTLLSAASAMLLLAACVHQNSPETLWFADLVKPVDSGKMTIATRYFMRSRETVTLGAEGEAYVRSLLDKYSLIDAHDDPSAKNDLHAPCIRICFRWCRAANGEYVKYSSPELLIPAIQDKLYFVDISQEERLKLEEYLQSRQ